MTGLSAAQAGDDIRASVAQLLKRQLTGGVREVISHIFSQNPLVSGRILGVDIQQVEEQCFHQRFSVR